MAAHRSLSQARAGLLPFGSLRATAVSFFRQAYGRGFPLARAHQAPPYVTGPVVRVAATQQQGSLSSSSRRLSCLLACYRLRERAPKGTLPHAMRAAESLVLQGLLY